MAKRGDHNWTATPRIGVTYTKRPREMLEGRRLPDAEYRAIVAASKDARQFYADMSREFFDGEKLPDVTGYSE